MTQRQSPFGFVALVFVLSVPFYWAGGRDVLPPGMPLHLPAVTFMAFVPLLAGLFLTWRENGAVAAKALLLRLSDIRKITPIWYLPILLLMPSVMTLEFVLANGSGTRIALPHVPFEIPPLLFVVFLVFAIGEEVGWTGYATEPLLARWGPIGTSLLLGVVWAVWHFVPYLSAHGLHWALWQCGVTVLSRIVIVWLFRSTGGSVAATILFHATINESDFLYPDYGSHYDPVLTAIILAPFAGAILAMWLVQSRSSAP